MSKGGAMISLRLFPPTPSLVHPESNMFNGSPDLFFPSRFRIFNFFIRYYQNPHGYLWIFEGSESQRCEISIGNVWIPNVSVCVFLSLDSTNVGIFRLPVLDVYLACLFQVSCFAFRQFRCFEYRVFTCWSSQNLKSQVVDETFIESSILALDFKIVVSGFPNFMVFISFAQLKKCMLVLPV